MLKEYRACLFPDYADVEHMWLPTMAIDLRYVTTARPFDEQAVDNHQRTLVTVVSFAREIIIGEAYERFLRDWHSVKR